MSTSLPLSPTARTTVTRGRDRARDDRAELHALLDDALVAHLGVVVGEGAESHPVVLPVAFAVDLEGPDEGGTLYVHGSVAARWLTAAVDAVVCVTVTELDGLVAARSGFHHSMNYRSAVVIGRARVVGDHAERAHALDLTVDHMVPGRAATLRPPTRKEPRPPRCSRCRWPRPRSRCAAATRSTSRPTSRPARGPVWCRSTACPARPSPPPTPTAWCPTTSGSGPSSGVH